MAVWLVAGRVWLTMLTWSMYAAHWARGCLKTLAALVRVVGSRGDNTWRVKGVWVDTRHVP
eukprot:14397892-Heterocapsa_arctica.AAC.1